ncbi:MAG: hypothetical protein ACRCWQ_12015, partial [Bacilli bacterium]
MKLYILKYRYAAHTEQNMMTAKAKPIVKYPAMTIESGASATLIDMLTLLAAKYCDRFSTGAILAIYSLHTGTIKTSPRVKIVIVIISEES